MWTISRKARSWSPTFCLIFHILFGSSQVCNSPLINSNLRCKDWIILYVAVALTNTERIRPFCKKTIEVCWPTSAPAAWQWINLRCWFCNQRMHSPKFHSWKACRCVNWAWRHWSHQWYLPKQDTNDRTSLQQISTFSGSKTDSCFDNKIQLIYSTTVMDSTGGISPLLLW